MSARNDDIPFSVPARKRSARPAAIIGIAVVVIAVAACIGASLLGELFAPPSFEVVREEASGVDDAASADSEAEAVDAKKIFVHVGGEVVAPGLYELASGSRVNDAIAAAGGFTDNAARDAVNLAREVADGEQIIVASVQSESEQGSVVAEPGGSSGAPRKININTATAEELDSLPGVGASTAQKIVADRAANGPFKTTEDLKRVSGIGDKKYSQLADLITVG